MSTSLIFLLSLIAGPSLAVADTKGLPKQKVTFSSFFDGKNENLIDSGWSQCQMDITWSVDTDALAPKVASREIRRLNSAFEQWSDATGLNFRFTGTDHMTYSTSTNQLTSETMPREDHIAVAFLPARMSPLLSENVYGFGMPTSVIASTRTIVAGAMVVKAEIARSKTRSAPNVLDNLYLHELGHVMGLGHVKDSRSIMNPIIHKLTELSPGERSGAQSVTKLCN